MWIYDTSVRKGITIWGKEGDLISTRQVPLAPCFYLHLPDPNSHLEMLEALAAGYRVEECTFRTVYGPLEGYAIHAGRRIAEAIEQQTHRAAQLYNVDIRLDQRWMAEEGLFPCSFPGESRFAPGFNIPLTIIEVRVHGDPFRKGEICRIEVGGNHRKEFSGPERTVLAALFEAVEARDPEVILLPDADIWMPQIVQKARKHGLRETISRTGRFRSIASRSYWSYGRMEYKGSALLPEGRILIDTSSSFNYREGGLEGVILASRLTGITPNLAARLTAGTLVSSYEVYEALKRGIVIPFRKSDPEGVRRCDHLRSRDRGGMMFQPVAGVYERVHELDFTSLYPSIIVLHNLSPETLHAPAQRGFLPEVLKPLLSLRRRTKQMKKEDPAYAGRDSILKWMLVTCFGYTGFRNAKFGRIEVHEQITSGAREILLRTKTLADEMGFRVLHGIVDCLWVQEGNIASLKDRVEQETGLATECDTYDWIVFLPMNDGKGAYNRYFGKLTAGTVKQRGVMARRGDTPAIIRAMQEEIFTVMARASTAAELAGTEADARAIRARYEQALRSADPGSLVIRRRISRSTYERNCVEGAAVEAYRQAGIELSPGMEIGYVVRDARTHAVDLPWVATAGDPHYYRTLLEKAWTEVAFPFAWIRNNSGREAIAWKKGEGG